MLILGIILWGMLLGAAAQWLLRGNSRKPRDWCEALVAGLLAGIDQGVKDGGHPDRRGDDQFRGVSPMNRKSRQAPLRSSDRYDPYR